MSDKHIMEFQEGGRDLAINRLSHAMERRALMIANALQKAAPHERVACTKPYIERGGDQSWEYRWDLILLRYEQSPPPSAHVWEVYSKQEVRT